METQTYIVYEMNEGLSGRQLMTESREEALGYFEKGWLIVEHHVTICKPSKHTSTRLNVAMTWNNNPDFDEE